MNCHEDETNQGKKTWTRLHNCAPQVVILSVTDGLTEFWTATDFLTADYNLKICEQQIYFHRYRTTDYLYFFFKSSFIIIIIIIISSSSSSSSSSIFKPNFIPKYQNRN